MRLLTIATLLAVASALQACTPEEQAHSESIFTALGAPLPAGLADESVNETPEIEQVVVDVSTPEPVVEQEPPFDPNECVTIFRLQTCEAGVLHHLDANMNWID